MTHRMITASRLRDGAVVWFSEAGLWVEEIGRATASDDDGAVARLLADARAREQAGEVIAPYEVEVVPGPGGPEPVRLRESIRAHGPTVEYG